jgi:hypothetical protein
MLDLKMERLESAWPLLKWNTYVGGKGATHRLVPSACSMTITGLAVADEITPGPAGRREKKCGYNTSMVADQTLTLVQGDVGKRRGCGEGLYRVISCSDQLTRARSECVVGD